ncbi:MAG: MerR family transcriptional regulator [SAR202 cluster bacterium]|nr:MerR family transcriptional regulator [SAR202 cluster bacterium]
MNFDDLFDQEEPIFVISVAARMLGVQTQTLRYYERIGLIEPSRTSGNQRVFSARDIERIRQIRTLVEDMGVNLAGVEVVLKLFQRIDEADEEIARLRAEVERLKGGSQNES